MTRTTPPTSLTSLDLVNEAPPTTSLRPLGQRGGGGGSRNLVDQPRWLADKVANTRRAAKPQPCPRCSAPTLTGPDHDTCARVVRVDTTSVDRIHEIAALLTGCYSYNLTRGELHYREPHHIHSANQTEPIHLNHQCDMNGATLW